MNIDKTTYKALTNIDHKEAADKGCLSSIVYICSHMLHLDTLLSVT